jgi:nucleoside phosphorylase
METIGLIAATPQESAALLRTSRGWKRTALGPFRGVRFRLANRNCWLVTTGMGCKRAMAGTRALLAAANPQLLVSFGIAGAVQADLRIGYVVVANQTCLLESGMPGPFRPLTPLSNEAWQAAAQALLPEGTRLVPGTVLTTRGSQILLEGAQGMVNPVLEMETAGIAQIAAEMGIPLISIRSISDGPQAPIPFDLETVLDENDHLRLGKLLGLVLRRPRILFQSRQLLRNSSQAADHAARALLAALSQPFITDPVLHQPAE